MALETPPFDVEKIKDMNGRMLEGSGKREELSKKWDQALARSEGRMVAQFQTVSEVLPRQFVIQNTIRALLMQAIVVGGGFFSSFLDGLQSASYRNMPLDTVLTFITLGLGISFIIMLPRTFKAVKLFIRNGTVEKSMKQVGECVLATLHQMQVIRTDLKNITVRADRDQSGFVHCWLDGGTTYEKTIFLEAVQELVNPIDNPRYLLMRQSKWGPFERTDYHAVPQLIGKKKGNVQFFLRQWKKRLGKADFIFTRTADGRQQLLQARLRAMSASFVKKSNRISVWR